ncbi:hypothetical protein E4N62_06275 [Streptomyces sp. MNU76]|nr:hypothetical protein [Streptomyces sp. MNU76]
MLAGAAAGGLPFSWVAADADYGKDPALRSWLHERKIRYVLAVPVTLPGQMPADGFAHRLPIRRSTEEKQLAGGRVDFEYAYFLVHAPADDPVTKAIVRAGVRWKIEENNELAKQITGLGQYQVRRWTSWHRHVTCAMLALAFLTVQRARRPDSEPASVPTGQPTGPNPAGEGKAQTTAGRSTFR